jgi:hypothetical protein
MKLKPDRLKQLGKLRLSQRLMQSRAERFPLQAMDVCWVSVVGA